VPVHRLSRFVAALALVAGAGAPMAASAEAAPITCAVTDLVAAVNAANAAGGAHTMGRNGRVGVVPTSSTGYPLREPFAYV
jgi:hypothetical protein